MTSASLHMQNTCTTKNFIRENCQILTYRTSKKRERTFLLIFTIFLLHFFCLYSPQKTSNFSFKDLPARSSYFQRRALWYVNNREQKKVEWHKDFLVFFLGGVQTLNLQNYYALQEEAEDSMQIFFFFSFASDAFLSQGIIINILLYCRGLRRRRT